MLLESSSLSLSRFWIGSSFLVHLRILGELCWRISLMAWVGWLRLLSFWEWTQAINQAMRNLGNGLRTGDCLWEASKGNGKSLDDLDLIWFHFLKVFLNSASDAMKEQPAEQVGCCFRHWKARIVEDIIRKLGLKLGSLSILAICILCGSVSPCWIWSVGLGIWWPDLVSLIENGLWWTVFELFGGKICMGLAPFWVYGSWFWHFGFEDSKKARGHLGIDLLFSSLNLLSCFLGFWWPFLDLDLEVCFLVLGLG